MATTSPATQPHAGARRRAQQNEQPQIDGAAAAIAFGADDAILLRPFLHFRLERHELGVEVSDHVRRCLYDARLAVGTQLFAHVDERRASLYFAEPGGAEEQLLARDVVHHG